MQFDSLDNYLLTGAPDKATVIAEALAHRSQSTGAAPFYRAFEVMGARAADEALMALRLVLAGKKPEDEWIVAMRTAIAQAKSSDPQVSEAGRAAYAALLK